MHARSQRFTITLPVCPGLSNRGFADVERACNEWLERRGIRYAPGTTLNTRDRAARAGRAGGFSRRTRTR